MYDLSHMFPFQDCFVAVTRGYRNKLLKQPKKELVDGAVPTIRNPDTHVVKPPRKAPLKRSSSLPPPAEEEDIPKLKACTSLLELDADDEIAESSLVRFKKDGLLGGTGGGGLVFNFVNVELFNIGLFETGSIHIFS